MGGGAPFLQGVSGRGLGRCLRLSFAPGLDLVFSGFGFTVKALRSALVLVVSRLRRFRFFVFSFEFGVGSACGRGGFVFVMSWGISPSHRQIEKGKERDGKVGNGRERKGRERRGKGGNGKEPHHSNLHCAQTKNGKLFHFTDTATHKPNPSWPNRIYFILLSCFLF